MTKRWRAERKLRKDIEWLRKLGAHTWPTQQRAVEAGCTCVWFRNNSIVEFDQYCPIWDLHRIGHGMHDLNQAVVLATRVLARA